MSSNIPDKQGELFEAQTTWFHVFVAMIESGDVAKIGPHAFTVYATIKAHTNFSTGRSFPAIETVVEKSGISRAQVVRSLSTLEEHGYLKREKKGRHNVYTLREKVEIHDNTGRPTAVATWDYLPGAVTEATAQLKHFLLSGKLGDGKVIYIENLNMNVQVNHDGAHGTQNIAQGIDTPARRR